MLVREPLERLTDGGWADVQSFGELTLGEGLSGCQLSADDLLPQGPVSLIRERRTGGEDVLSLRSHGAGATPSSRAVPVARDARGRSRPAICYFVLAEDDRRCQSAALADRHRTPAAGRLVQRLDGASLPHGIVAAEQWWRLAADREGHVLGFQPVGVGYRDLDPLDAVLAAHLDHPNAAMPGIVEEQRALLAYDLELVAGRERQPRIEMPEDVVAKAHRRGERDVDTLAADHLLGADALGLAGDQPGATDAVAADIHQRSALESGAEAGVRRVVGAEAARRTNHPD